MKKSKKSTLQIMYEEIKKNGGPSGPISEALFKAYENRNYDKFYENKRIIQFKRIASCRLK